MNRTPERVFYPMILATLVQRGGNSTTQEVIAHVGKAMRGRLTSDDVKRLKSGYVRWQNTVCWARKHLVDYGYLSSHSPHGIWSITPAGRTALNKLIDALQNDPSNGGMP